MKKIVRVAIGFLLVGAIVRAQNPQTTTAPIIPENAKYVNGVAPGYYSTAGSGLSLNVGPGTANCAGTIIAYAGGTLTLTASMTNYIYLNTSANCAPATKTTAFTSSDIPLAKVVTGSSSITSIVDDRTMFFPSSNGIPITPSSVAATRTIQGSNLAIAVTAYGATGNGTTDDHAAIQNAINVASTANLPVVFPPGTYLVGQAGSNSYALSLPSNTHLIGFPGSHIILAPTGSNEVRLLSSISTSNIIIEGLEIDGNNTNQTSPYQQNHCVFLASTTNVTVTNNHIHDCDGDGVFLWSSSSVTPPQVANVNGNYFSGVFRYGTDIDGGVQINVHDNIYSLTANASIGGDLDTGAPFHDIDVHDNIVSTTATNSGSISFTSNLPAADLPNYGRINIHDNHLYGAAYILLWGLPHSRISGNSILNSLVSPGSTPENSIINVASWDVTVSDNTITYSGGVTPSSSFYTSIAVSCNSLLCPAAGIGRNRIQGNTITLSQQSAIHLDASSDNIVSGNTINGVLQTSGYSAGIEITNSLSANNHVSGNRILDSQSSPTTLYAFDFSGAAANQTEGPDQITNMVDGTYYSGSVANIISPSGIFPLPNPNQSTINALPNDSGAGTVLNELASVTCSPYDFVCPTTAGQSNGVVGIVVGNAGTSGNAVIQINGVVNCVFSNATTAQDFVQISSSTNGECQDVGSTYPTSGQVLGRVLSTNGSAGTYQMYLFPAEMRGTPSSPVVYSSAGTITPSTHIVQGSAQLSSGAYTLTLSGSSGYGAYNTYTCTANDISAVEPIQSTPQSYDSVIFTGTGSDYFSYMCVGH